MLLAVLSKCWWCISTSISTQKARGAALEGWFRKEVGYTLSFSLEWRTRFCARGGRHGALTFIERAAFSAELPILLCSNLSSICIQSPFRDNFISVSWLLSTIYFPGVAVCCNILPLWKEFLSSASTGTFLSSKPLMHFWTKVGENVKIFARPKCLLVQQKKVGDDGGWHESRLCTTKVCHSAQSSIFEKARRSCWNRGHYAPAVNSPKNPTL